jgi:M6 family metalloprotease-like protein
MILIILILAGYQWLIAAYLTDVSVQVTQPNGNVINCFASGDEYHNWLHDAEGYTIIQSPITGNYTYAIQSGDTVSASDLIVGINNPQLAGLTPRINISSAEYQQRRTAAFPVPEMRNAPTTGTINNIVIYIRFNGNSEFGQSISTYGGWFNSSASSLKNYFLESSYQQLTVNTTFYPTPSTMVVSWQDSHPRGYYSPYNAATNTIGYSDSNERLIREHTLLVNAVNGVSSQVPTGLNIDSNNDGLVDNVCFIIKGSTDAWASLLWPHRWSLYSQTVYINNKRVYDYNFQLQNFLTTSNVGVLCHEFFHSLGAPDLYRYSQNPPEPVGIWDVMAVNTNPPQHMGAYMKWKYGGWIPAPTVIRAHQTYTLNPVTSSTNNVYRINSPSSTNEYFIVEYRKKSGTYENQLPGSGLLIYRINSSAGNGNASEPPDEVYIYRPNGTLTLTGDIESAHYSSQTGRTVINATTNPSPFLSSGNEGGLDIDQIGSAGTTISFRLGIMPYQTQIHGTVALSPVNQSDVVLTSIRLRRTDNDVLVSQINPNTIGTYSTVASPGSYYLEYELFQPSLNKFYYPVTSQTITVPQETEVIELPPVTLTQYSINSPKVSSNQSHPYFKTIEQALDRITSAVNNGYNGDSVSLYLFPDEYQLSSFSFNYTNTANDALNLNIIGLGSEGASIEPWDNFLSVTAHRVNATFSKIKFVRELNTNGNYFLIFSPSTSAEYSFINCHFGKADYNSRYACVSFDGLSGLSFYNCDFRYLSNLDTNNSYITTGNGSLKFLDCSDINVSSSIFTNNEAFGGGGIYLEECEDVDISNCTFEANAAVSQTDTDSSITWGYPGGAIFSFNSSEIHILNNQFFHNLTTGSGGAVYLQFTSQFDISDNLFRDNLVYHVGLSGTQSDALGFDNCTFTSNDVISHNIIHSGFEPYQGHPSDFIAIGSSCTGTLNLANGLFIKGSFDSHEYKKIVWSFSPVNMNFSNCIFQTRDIDANFAVDPTPPQTAVVNVSYSLFENGYTGLTSTSNNTSDVSDMQLDANYYPIWNQTTMSRCIDAGTGPWDADETPADIGAVRAIEHSYWDYEFDDQHDWQKWYWVSYPVLNTVTTGALQAGEFFEELLQLHQVLFNGNLVNVPVYLDEIKWYNQYEYSIKWIELIGGWSMNLSDHSVSSPQGYKIKLKEDIDPAFSWPVHLVESGFKTPESTQFPIYANTENWLGYFKEDPASPQDAFASIWNDIEMVRGKNWSLERVNGLLTGKSGTINYGDMVIVRTYSNHTFQWESSIVTPPETKAVPKKFLFDEKPDYIPVYVSLPDSLKTDLKEIGLYVDGICKGAVVVEDSLEQISAYVDAAAELSEGNVEFVLYYEGSKRVGNELRTMNINKGRLQAQYGDAGASYPFFEIQITPDDVDNIPPTDFSLRQNYPNPFNPTTTITYSLPEAARVQLDIYNLKGQLVKTLVNGDEPAGMHSVVWDGRDSNNAAVASGVYFYRVSTPQATQTKRMLLMKISLKKAKWAA